MVELVLNDFSLVREKFERLLKIKEEDRTDEQLFNLMRLTARFKIFESFKMSDMHREICRKMFVKTFERGQVIFKQGDEGDAYYFVLRGCVDLYMYDVDQLNGKTKLKYLASVTPSNGFGELALLYECPRTATAIPNNSTDLIVFKKKHYNKFVKDLHEKDLLDLVRFYYSIPIFKKEPISNILKFCLRTKKKMLDAYEPFMRYNEYTDDYCFVKSGSIRAYIKIKVNNYLLSNAHFMSESKFCEELNKLQLKYTSKKKEEERDLYDVYEKVLTIMQFDEKEMFAEYFAARYKRLDVYFLPVLPTEIISINVSELNKINSSLNQAIHKFACPINNTTRIFQKLYQTIIWKDKKSKLLFDVLHKKN
jgi:hypothetical protein